jgi:hypothetical protein
MLQLSGNEGGRAIVPNSADDNGTHQTAHKPLTLGSRNRNGPMIPRHNWPTLLVERARMWIACSNRQTTVFAAGALLLLSLSLGGCVTSATGSSSLMDARAETPARPKTGAFMPVEDLPQKRDNPAMTADEVSKVRKELIDARDRQAAKSKGNLDSTAANKP